MSGATTTLNCRLLAASYSAYFIAQDGTFTPDTTDPIYIAAGWIGTPAAIVNVNLPEDIDACLIGRTADGIVIAFRGTLPLDPITLEVLQDWLQDFWVDPDPMPAFGPGVRVHRGFWNALSAIATALDAALKALLANGSAPLFITGHSKGGAMAPLAAMRYVVNNPMAPLPTVTTFAAPRSGNTAFAAAFLGKGLVQTRYENFQDVAPLFPPSAADIDNVLVPALAAAFAAKKVSLAVYLGLGGMLTLAASWDYASIGSGDFINQNGTITTPADPVMQWGYVLAAFEAGNYEAIAHAHCCSCPATNCQGGYMTGVCAGAGLCPAPVG